MRRIVTIALLLAVCFALTGCYSYDAQHNRAIKQMVMKDLSLIHTDIDFLLDLETPTMLDGGIYW